MKRSSVRTLALAGALLAAGIATAAIGSTAGAPARNPAAADTVGGRYIVRLADGAARTRLLAEVIGEPLTLEARHERAVRGLRSIHEAAYADAVDAMNVARAVGSAREIDRLWIVNAIVAELDPAAVAALEADPAVAEVVPDRRLTLGMSAADRAAGATPGPAAVVDPSAEVAFLNVPEAWADGITGKGAIVANTDTGVNGDDSTLGDRWRGYVAGSDASWYAPIPLTVFPEDDGSIGGFGHGTATMGLLTGGEASFGVAYDATWIAGDVFEGGEGFVSNALRTLQWLADPDGDPGTSSDVPDVVSNSYGLTDVDPATDRIRCDPIFDDAIDALEAAGAIVIWSAGNEGDGGVTSPANRADSPVNAFAVGGVTLQGIPVPSSGRGPSACGGATKPEVVAPGDGVLTRNRFDQFIQVTGTSFSTPMVGGVLALMRSKNPTITPEAAKTILLETAVDLDAPGDDNATGRGRVDAAAALARVQRPAQPLARLVGYRTPDTPGKLGAATIDETLILRPGGTHSLRPLLSNHGPAIGGTQGTLSSPTPGVTVTRSTIPLSAAPTGEFFGPAEGDAFALTVDGSVDPGAPIVLDLAIQGATVGPFRMIVRAGDPVAGDLATHDNGRVRLSVTNFGGLGYYTGLHGAGFALEGDGFRFPTSSQNWLFHAGFMAGTGPGRLSDGIPYGEDTQTATDWVPRFGFPITVDAAAGGQRIRAAYDDRKAPAPLGIEVVQESFTFPESGDDAFVLLQYILTNTTSATIGGLRVGLFADWDLPGGNPSETAGWDPDRRLGFMVPSAQGPPAVGVVWLDAVPPAQLTYRVLERDAILESTLGNPLAGRVPVPAEAPGLFEGEFSDAEKWQALASGQSVTAVTEPQDLWQVIGVGPISIAAGATDTVAVALVAGETRSALEVNAEAAREAYFVRVLGTEPPPPPDPPGDLALLQNFPNPFRAGTATTIRFDVPTGASGRLDLSVYDVSGRRVTTLSAGEATAGERAVSWDGLDAEGRFVPAGVYVIRLVVGGQERSVRALVLP